MKKIIFVIGALMLVGCETDYTINQKRHFENSENHIYVTIDSCEYIFIDYGSGSWGSHKGNCKNHK